MASEPTGEGPDRRRLLAGMVAGAAAAIGGTLTALAARFLGGPPGGGAVAPVSVGPASTFASDTPVEVTLAYSRPDAYRTEDRRETAFLVRLPEGLVALSSTCTHLGCSVHWDPAGGLFKCPCHGGVYRADGTVVSGPPPRPLTRLPIEIRAGQVFVHPADLS